MSNDPVNKPKHYNQGDIECIDALESMLGEEGLRSYCQGNAMKYLWRHRYKGKEIEDLEKAQWYIERLKGTYGTKQVSTISNADMQQARSTECRPWPVWREWRDSGPGEEKRISGAPDVKPETD